MESIHDYLKNFIFLSEEEVKKLSKDELAFYNEEVKTYRDWKNVIDYAREQGRRKAHIEIAEEKLLKGCSIEFVCEITDLSIEEVQEIADFLKEN
jgi:predicted transposase/invertase (TIGR01784 family)